MEKPTIADAVEVVLKERRGLVWHDKDPETEEEYDKILWSVGFDKQSQSNILGIPKDRPKWEDVKKAMDELEARYASFEFQRKRKPEYPKIEDQLDLLYHKGIDGWKEEIQKVKDKYPKPVVEEPKVEEPKEAPSE